MAILNIVVHHINDYSLGHKNGKYMIKSFSNDCCSFVKMNAYISLEKLVNCFYHDFHCVIGLNQRGSPKTLLFPWFLENIKDN